MQTLLQDIRYGIRTLLKTPGFTAVAVLSLALGIGANTAIFSIIDALMLKSLPVREPQRLVSFGPGNQVGIFGGIADRPMQIFSWPMLRQFRERTQAFTDVSGMFSLPSEFHPFIAGGPHNEALKARLVTGNFFNVLGVGPAAGRVFDDGEDKPLGSHPDVVISYGYWQRRFGGSASAVGQSMRIADRLYTIVGVAAPEFYGTVVGEAPDAWLPLSMLKQLPPYFEFSEQELVQSFYLLGRLRPGVSLEAAGANTNLLLKPMLREFAGPSPGPEELRKIERAHVDILPAANGISHVRRQFSGSLKILMGVVALVLLIACGNVANLLLSRATARQKEFALRTAIGSNRFRLVRQLMTESLLLSGAGGILGMVIAWWGGYVLISMVSTGPERLALSVEPNGAVLGFTLAVSVLTGLLFGLAPAFRGSRVDLGAALKEGRTSTAARGRSFASGALVVSQVALSLLLLVGAGLFIRSLRNLQSIDTGFDRNDVLDVMIETGAVGYPAGDRLNGLYRRIEEQAARIPGVAAASFTFFAFNQGAMQFDMALEGRHDEPGRKPVLAMNIVGPSFFDVTRTAIREGRSFGAGDTAKSPAVAVINQTAASKYFSGSPLGKHLVIGDSKAPPLEIVGVVKDAKYQELTEAPAAVVYLPYTQRPEFLRQLLVRTRGGHEAVAADLRRVIETADPNLPIFQITTLSALVDGSIQTQRLITQLSSFFGGLALLLASLGLYGVLSYSVARRTGEIGIRMALGAQRGRVLRMVMHESMRLIGLGVLIGIPAALFASRYLESLLYNLKPYDAFTLLAAVVVLSAIGAIAGFLPARRAAAVDPMVALRYE